MTDSKAMRAPVDLMLELHLFTTKKLKELAGNTEQHFTWLREVLVEAKRSFKS